MKVGDEDVSPWPAGVSFDFYLGFEPGEGQSKTDVVMANREAVATEQNKTGEFGTIEFKKPGTYVFTIEEVEPAGTQNHKKNGIIYSTDKVTLTVEVGEKLLEPGVLEVKSKTYNPANGQAEEGLITNNMDYPSYAPSVTKVLKDDNGPVPEADWAGKSFTFDLAMRESMSAEQKANVIMPETEKTVNDQSEGHKETFGNIAFKAAGTYEFTIPHLDAKYDSFYVIEQELPGYFTIYGALQESTLVTGQGRDRAGEGEYIINRVVKVSLPETGGPGTSMIYLLGIALIVLAGGGYILRNRRLLVTRPGSGHGRKGGDPMG